MLKKLVRSVQVEFPSILDAKFAIRDAVHKAVPGFLKHELEGVQHLKPNLAVDVGAHRGQTLIAFQKHLTCPIVAFEPNQILAKKLSDKYHDVMVNSVALSDHEGSFKLNIPYYKNYRFDGLATTESEEEAKGWFNEDRFYWFDEKNISIESMEVPFRTLDSYELPVGLLKLHAQRAEIGIINGALNTIKKYKPVIITAWTWDDEADLLRSLGYRPSAYELGGFDNNRFGEEFTYWFM